MTSVRATIITVTSMLSVIIPRDLIIVPVSLDTLEMEVIARVMTCFILSLFTDIKLRYFSVVLRSGSIKACVKRKGGGLSSTVFKIMK